MPTRHIDLNVDMGESFGLYRYGSDEEIIPFVSSANLACGFHGGDAVVMGKSVALAKAHGVAIGAHVGFPDLMGFGRRRMSLRPGEAAAYTLYQLGALDAFVKTAGQRLQHVKAHGALYMMLLEDRALSEAFVDAVRRYDDRLMIYTIAGSETDEAGKRAGVKVVSELFADRGYFADGSVKMFDWRIEEAGGTAERIGERIAAFIKTGQVASIDGGMVSIEAQTICVHSDTPGSAGIAKAIRKALDARGCAVQAPSKR